MPLRLLLGARTARAREVVRTAVRSRLRLCLWALQQKHQTHSSSTKTKPPTAAARYEVFLNAVGTQAGKLSSMLELSSPDVPSVGDPGARLLSTEDCCGGGIPLCVDSLNAEAGALLKVCMQLHSSNTQTRTAYIPCCTALNFRCALLQ